MSYFSGMVRRKACYEWVEVRRGAEEMETVNKSNYIQKCCCEGEEENEVIVGKCLE